MNKLEVLKEELRFALEDAVMGAILRPSLVGRLKMIARSILLRHGLGKSHVDIKQQGNGFEVKIYLQQPGAVVREIWLSLGGM